MSTLFHVLYSIVTLYMLLLFIRILLTWFGGLQSMGRPAEILSAITDPYLNLFRGMRFLRIGYLDFSPIFAIMLLTLVSSVLNHLTMHQQVTIGLLLAIIASMVFSAVSFFAFLFLALAVIRLIGILANLGTGGHFMATLDTIFQPMSFRMAARFFRGQAVSYTTALTVIAAILAGVSLGARVLGPVLVDLLVQLPF
ncbi:YggT family protein [Spirochaeta africana]|uniref:YGGT family protein n=1 Tax=Spirochaeta africana (strain ATCC 700263 / DSM 8902 / Z-7692) TaxID=889378 RepID=H9UL69_SPIAZ|nr:YggT family protein [Spirochaeta africana]AFG38262.1 YGGT family protein [Spirochaeta africana DSM 8902]